jgi:hypothetical protein
MRGHLSRHATSTVLFCAAALALMAATPRQLVGDGGEYFSMARSMYVGTDPGVPRHFWGYPLLAVPWLYVLIPLKVDQLWSFALLNLALFATAWWHASSRWPLGVRLALFVSPVIWWLDKAHTEVLTFSALVVAWATWRAAPWWALTFCGLATMQNPPLGAALAGFAGLSAWSNRAWLRDWRWWAGLLTGLALAGAHAAFYLATVGRFTTLGDTADRSAGLAAWWVVLFEPNASLLPYAPALALLVLVCVVVALARCLASRDGVADLTLSSALGVVFLLAFTRVGNINHGGTPGPSRYTLWLVALAAPWLVAGRAAGARWRRAMTALALVSAGWSTWAFWPGRQEAPLPPTRVAAWLWTQHPAWMDPPPEVFVERLSGADEAWLPIATRRCEKVLLMGRGDGKVESPWPAACPPVAIPETCRPAGVLCYANRTDAGYVFRASKQASSLGFHFDGAAAWPERGLAVAVALARERSWTRLRPVRSDDRDWWLRAATHVAGAEQFNAVGGCLVVLRRVGPHAQVTMRLPSRGTATVIDATTGQVLRGIPVDTAPGERVDLDIPGPADLLLLVIDYGAR